MSRRLLALALIAACSTPATTTTLAVETITGVFNFNEAIRFPNQACTGTGGFADIHAGAQVVVRDQSGDIIGTSNLGEGIPVEAGSELWRCAFPFTVEVPADRTFYTVEVADRGEVTFSQADMEASGWVVALELG